MVSLLKAKEKYYILFSKKELVDLFKYHGVLEMKKRLVEHKLQPRDIFLNPEKIDDVISASSKKISQDRDLHEIFASVFIFHNFFEKDTEICFELNNKFDKKRDHINSFDDLNKYREGTFSDFGLRFQGGIRLFQLKRYREELSAEKLSDFIKKVVAHYGNDLGIVNLLIILQSPDKQLSNEIFYEINEKIKIFNWSFKATILISYNEDSKFSVINQVYPIVTTTRRQFKLPSQQEDMY